MNSWQRFYAKEICLKSLPWIHASDIKSKFRCHEFMQTILKANFFAMNSCQQYYAKEIRLKSLPWIQKCSKVLNSAQKYLKVLKSAH